MSEKWILQSCDSLETNYAKVSSPIPTTKTNIFQLLIQAKMMKQWHPSLLKHQPCVMLHKYLELISTPQKKNLLSCTFDIFWADYLESNFMNKTPIILEIVTSKNHHFLKLTHQNTRPIPGDLETSYSKERIRSQQIMKIYNWWRGLNCQPRWKPALLWLSWESYYHKVDESDWD